MKNHKIALIDDSADLAALINHILEDRVTHFPEVSKFEDSNFSLVLCDLGLQETWGFETVAKLMEKTTAPIIVLTGIAGENLEGTTVSALLEIGVKEVLFKDIINTPQFKLKVLEIIAKAQLH